MKCITANLAWLKQMGTDCIHIQCVHPTVNKIKQYLTSCVTTHGEHECIPHIVRDGLKKITYLKMPTSHYC